MNPHPAVEVPHDVHHLADPALLPLVRARSSGEADRLVESLVSDVLANVVDPILLRALKETSRDLFDDLRGDVAVRLLARLRTIAGDPRTVIANFEDYAAVVTRNAHNDHLRRTFPERAKLKNRIRYALNHDGRFDVRSREDGMPLVALRGGAGDNDATLAVRKLAAVIVDILASHPGPLALDVLVSLAAQRLGLRDRPSAPAETPVAARHVRIHEQIESADYLKHLWRQICELPIRQRFALLLTVRDDSGEAVVRLFPLTGTASVRQVATALELPDREFAELWPQLPLQDADVAVRLGITRQQTINLRKCARERLARRMSRARQGEARR